MPEATSDIQTGGKLSSVQSSGNFFNGRKGVILPLDSSIESKQIHKVLFFLVMTTIELIHGVGSLTGCIKYVITLSTITHSACFYRW